ncbi:MAG: putative drug exporter of the superfamily [Solirubrobacteraceae bacterium]
MMVGFVVLAITLGSLLTAGLALLTAVIGVGIGLVGLQALTDAIEVSETAPILATMLGLAVGIDQRAPGDELGPADAHGVAAAATRPPRDEPVRAGHAMAG